MALPPLQSLLDLFPDNTFGLIEAVDMRDQTTALYQGILDNASNFANYLPLSGGTLTGALELVGTPVSPNQAANKAYVDTFVAGSGFVNRNGDTMQGDLIAFNNVPPTSLSYTAKDYVDTQIATNKADTESKTVLLDGSNNMDGSYVPVNDQGVSTKIYVDDRDAATLASANAYTDTKVLPTTRTELALNTSGWGNGAVITWSGNLSDYDEIIIAGIVDVSAGRWELVSGSYLPSLLLNYNAVLLDEARSAGSAWNRLSLSISNTQATVVSSDSNEGKVVGLWGVKY